MREEASYPKTLGSGKEKTTTYSACNAYTTASVMKFKANFRPFY
jgi:hypothetical protein